MTNSFNNPCNKPNCCGGQCECQGGCTGKTTYPPCPKFDTCNAPVCPLDAKWQKRKHISGDKCCLYLLETAKLDAKANFAGAGLANVYEAIEAVKHDILSSSASINRTYTRAASTASRLHPKFTKGNLSCA